MATKSTIRPKQYACFTTEQQREYNSFTYHIRRYIDFCGEGYKKAQAYRLAGFDTKYPSQAANMLETKHPIILDLVRAIYGQHKVTSLTDETSNINKNLNALAIKNTANEIQKMIDEGDKQKAEQLKFYMEIAEGKRKTIRKTKKYNADKILTGIVVEEISDIKEQMQARKEVDRILGLNQIVGLGQVTSGNFTFNFVDASNKEEKEDSRNEIVLTQDEVQITTEVKEGDNGGDGN